MSSCWVAYAMGLGTILIPVVFGLLMFWIDDLEPRWIDDPEPRDQYGWRPSMDEQGRPL